MEGLSVICSGLGEIEIKKKKYDDDDDDGVPITYKKNEFCLDNLKDLQRFLRRDDPQSRDVFNQVCKWNTVAKDLIPIIEYCNDDRELVISAEDDWKLVQLVLTLFRNILAIQDISLQQVAAGSATIFLTLRDKFLELLFHENVMDLMIVLTQHVGGTRGYLSQDKLLLLDIFHYIFLGQEPEFIAKAPQKASKDQDAKESCNHLRSIMEKEETKRRLSRQRKLDRHSQFSGTFFRLAMDGSKTLVKGNPCATSSRDTVQRGPLKRIVWDEQGRLSSSKNILELLHDFVNQFLSVGYHGLMQSIRKDIEKEHHAIQSNDVAIFFQVAQFITAFQYHKLSSKILGVVKWWDVGDEFMWLMSISVNYVTLLKFIWQPKMENDISEVPVNKYADNTLFQGDICGPIAATMNEAMFILVISKWHYAFDGLKETGDYKFLSAAGSLMKNMVCAACLINRISTSLHKHRAIRMLDLVFKVLPEENSKEPQTARVLLYKIFYDQTDQGMTQFLLNLIKSFNNRKQPKSDLADLIEMIHVVLRLMENLQARGTLRVSKKTRKGRKKKIVEKATADFQLRQEDDNVTTEFSNNSKSDGKESIPVFNQSEDLELPEMNKSNTDEPSHQTKDLDIPLITKNDNGAESTQMENKKSTHSLDDMADGTGESSEDDEPAATNEVDFKVSTLVSSFANNTIIQNLCWLLKFYKNNSARTNHYIICMLQRICDDLELSPMIYQLSLLTIFNDILVEQKSSSSKEYANIVSFLTNLIRRMLRKMKSKPLLFVEILFWKTRRDCHYISSESLLHELGNLKKESKNWGSGSARDEGEVDSSREKRGIGRRSIADSLGDDEADFVISQEPDYQKDEDSYVQKLTKKSQRNGENTGETNKSISSSSNSEIGGLENSDDAQNKGKTLELKSLQVSKRKRRLAFDEELDTSMKNLSEKNPTRKRVRAFSKEQEDQIKSLFDQFKDNKRCSHMIASALEADNIFTPAQVSRKIKQLGLRAPQKKGLSKMKKHLIEEDGKDFVENEGEKESDEETLLSVMKRRKNGAKSTIVSEEVTTKVDRKRMPESTPLQDDSDQEILSSVLKKRSKKRISKAQNKIQMTTSVEDIRAGVSKDAVQRDAFSPEEDAGLSDKNTMLDLSDQDDNAKADQVTSTSIGKQVDELLINNADQNLHRQIRDELEDSGDEFEPKALKLMVPRRKSKMVIDFEDDD
ncbi:hypothetical protein GIB67_008227 [Kingdonia uniflora]|uniref:Timeless N-terminal domain-containing protein n=1 Tax=Kingdonia uniflora TaxID=39325 RepID=A0A7J7N5A8_9MAGN|nr:hypothetical protein GIB67_008227 [Kingdonia uniflora]